MKSYELLEAIGEAEDAVNTRKHKFLESMGWTYTCDTSSLWLWAKNIDGKELRVSESAAMHIAEAECSWPYTGEDEHPEGYSGPCGCDRCLFYG